MESGKQGGASSETSSDGSEQVNHDRTATKRSYECTYCKRGFTNAQALGGHMNIHRKDRAKAKQPSVQYNPVTSNNLNYHKNSNNHIDHEFVTSNNSNNFTVPSFLPHSSHHHVTSWYVKPIDHDHDLDHHGVYFQPGPSIPSTLPFVYPNYETTPNHASLALSNEELMGADLSLQIDCDDHEGVSRGLVNDDILDLELRLGYR